MLGLFLPGSIPPRIQYIAIGASIFLVLVIIYLIRKGRLKEGYSIIWFLISIGVALVSLFTFILDLFARLVGISYTPAAIFLLLLGGLFLLSLHYSVLVSRYDRRIRHLAQEHAMLKVELTKKIKE